MDLFSFIKASPTAFHAAAATASILDENGFEQLSENSVWSSLIPGGKYYVLRNGSSLIAFMLPSELPFAGGFVMAAAHSDSPYLKLKSRPETNTVSFTRLVTEPYGGMLMGPWFDRPLSVAGRLSVKTESGVSTVLTDIKEPCCIIPSVCPHLRDNSNKGVNYDPATDMYPLEYCDGDNGSSILDKAAAAASVPADSVLSADLYVYNPQSGCCWNNMVSAPRLDDLQSAYAILTGMLKAGKPHRDSVAVYCLFDNEEVGSGTRQGAAGTFLHDTISRICMALGMDGQQQSKAVAGSFMVSCDNAHSVHPSHPELSDFENCVYMNRGIVIKHNANQKYTTDSISDALFRTVCNRAGVPFQDYSNRSDQRGGSTLGNISTSQVSVSTVDIGLAQLAMHSCYETAGAADTEYLIKAMAEYYSLSFEFDGCNVIVKG